MTRVYTMRQGSYFRPLEWTWLEKAVLDNDVQEWLAKKDYSNARAVLVAGFRREFTTPAAGETEAAFKKRRRAAKKSRKENIVRIHAETEDEFQARMLILPDRVANWLANWRHRRVASGVKRWQPPPVKLPVTRKPRTITPFDAFCKRGPAPKGLDFVDKRCNLGDLRTARKAAWDKLSAEEQDEYRTIAIALMVDAVPASEIVTEKADAHTPEVVARAEDVTAHVDNVIHDLHESVGWGGLAIMGGPDENGEGRIHVTSVGTNRHGDTFLDVLLKTIRWTPLEFDTLFSLWVEQCREGPENSPDSTFSETARRAMEYVWAQPSGGAAATQPPYSTAITLASKALAEWAKQPSPTFRFPVCNFDEQDEVSRQQHIMFNALQNLSLAATKSPETSTLGMGIRTAGAIPAPLTGEIVDQDRALHQLNSDDVPPPLETDGDVSVPDFPPPGDYPVLRHETVGISTAFINYDPMCVDVDCQAAFKPLEAEPPVSAVDELTSPSSVGLETHVESSIDRTLTTGHRAPTNKRTEPSGVPMPGALGAPVTFRPMRARSSKSRQDTADGTLPLTASKRN